VIIFRSARPCPTKRRRGRGLKNRTALGGWTEYRVAGDPRYSANWGKMHQGSSLMTLFSESPPKSDSIRLGTLSVHPDVLKNLSPSSFLR
jgi:hypothetical protein